MKQLYSLLWESLVYIVCLIFNASDFFLSASLSLCLPDLKVTGLRFMAGICCESLSSVYLRMQRFGLHPPLKHQVTRHQARRRALRHRC